MDHLDRESFVIPSFVALYGIHDYCESPRLATWLKKELELIIADKQIDEAQHQEIEILWSNISVPAVDRLKAACQHFKVVAAQLEEAHAEAFCNKRLVAGPESFTQLRIKFCDEFRGGDWDDENCWSLINTATHGAGAAENEAREAIESSEDTWYVLASTVPGQQVPDWKLPLIDREIQPKCQFPARTCRTGRVQAFDALEREVYAILQRVESLAREAERLLKYGH